MKQHKGPGKSFFQGGNEEGKAQQPGQPTAPSHPAQRTGPSAPGESTPGESTRVCLRLRVDRSAHTQVGGSIWVCLRLNLHQEFHISSAPGNVFSVLGAHKTPVHLHIVRRSPSCALSSAHGQLWNHRSFRTSSKGLGGTTEQAPRSMEDHHPETLLLSPTNSNLSLVCGHSPWQHWYDYEEL